MTRDEPALEALDDAVQLRAYEVMARDIDLLDQLLLSINQGLVHLNGITHDRNLNFLSTLLLTRAFNSLWRAREDAVRGYPVQSLMLSRSVMEDWGTLLYVEKHPAVVELWLRGVIPEAQLTGRIPKFDNIWKEIAGELGERAREAYDVLSKFAHPRGLGLRWLFHYDTIESHLHQGPHFDPRALQLSLYFAVSTAKLLLDPVAQLQDRVLNSIDQEWLSKCLDLTQRASTFMEQVHNDALAVAAQGDTISGETQ